MDDSVREQIKQAAKLVLSLQKETPLEGYALTGAGLSKASNIPTFRGEDGLWEKYDIDEIATVDAWLEQPEKIWKLYVEGIRLLQTAEPNPAHIAIAQLQKDRIIRNVVTQNVDSLHQRAGTNSVIELHGNLLYIRCVVCDHREFLENIPKDFSPFCDCGGMLRPDVVLFDEFLPEKEISQAQAIAHSANLALVIGTSAEVIPAAGLPLLSHKEGAKILVFNPEKTAHVRFADVFVQGKCEETLPYFVSLLSKKK